MSFNSRRPHLLLHGLVIAIALAAIVPLAAQTAKRATQGPVKAAPFSAPLPDLKINLTSAESLCTADGKPYFTLIVRIINDGQGIANFSKVPFNTVVGVDSWGFFTPDGKGHPATKVAVLPQVGKAIVLNPGQEWTTTMTVVGLPNLPGPKQNKYGFGIRVDPANGVNESNEGNNNSGVGEPDPCFKK